MLASTMESALNEQINAELYSAYLYLSMEAFFHTRGLPGFANWMHCQFQEELAHAGKMFDFVNERGGRIVLKEIAAPPNDWDSPLAVFENTLEHEQTVTGLINNLVDLAIKESDHATNNFLQWFVAEQVEEEASAQAVVERLRLIGTSGDGLFQVDRELGQRVFTPPPVAA